MSSTSTLSRRQGWLRRGRAFLLGIALALIQMLILLLLWVLAWAGWPLFLLIPVMLLIPLFYLLIPGLEGFLTARQQNGEGCSGVDGGCLVGVVNIILFIAVSAFLALAIPPTCSPQCPAHAGESGGNGLLVGASLAVIVIQILGSVIGGILGGWIGGLLGAGALPYRARTRRTRARKASPGRESDAPSSPPAS